MSEAKERLSINLKHEPRDDHWPQMLRAAADALRLRASAEAEGPLKCTTCGALSDWRGEFQCRCTGVEAEGAKVPLSRQLFEVARRLGESTPDGEIVLCARAIVLAKEYEDRAQPPTPQSAGPIGLHEDFLRFCEQRQSSDMQALVSEIRRLRALNATAPAEGGREDTKRLDHVIDYAHEIVLKIPGGIQCVGSRADIDDVDPTARSPRRGGEGVVKRLIAKLKCWLGRHDLDVGGWDDAERVLRAQSAEIAELRQQKEQWKKLTEVDWEFILAKHNPSDASVHLICEVLGPALGYDLAQATNNLPGSSLWWAVRAKKLEAELADAKREAAAMAEIRALAFMRNAPAGDVAQHMQSVAESWQREIDALRADLERASEKIEKQNAALLRVYTLEDENNALKADLERERAQRNACERALAERDGQRRNDG